MTGSLHSRILRAQANLANLQRKLNEWALVPVLVRKDNKPKHLLAIAERKETFEKRYRQVAADAEELMRILEENYKLYFDLMPEELEITEGGMYFLIVF